jgi:RHS repeat-associated protein
MKRDWITSWLARYYSNIQGRFTSVDPENYQAMLDPSDPQSWNAYSYVNNNALRRFDPDGRGFWEKLGNLLKMRGWVSTETYLAREEEKQRQWLLNYNAKNGPVFYRFSKDVPWTRLDINSLTRDEVRFLYCESQKHLLT